MNAPLHFSIESSATPIFKRIVDCLANCLRSKGHRVTIEVPTEQGSGESQLQHLGQTDYDFIILTNTFTLTASYRDDCDRFAFELLPHKLIFIHHDNCLAKPDFDEEYLAKLFLAYQRVSHRSHHFCLEGSNCDDLRQLGLDSVHKISHASEYNKSPLSERPERGVGFVGHLLDFGHDFDTASTSHRIHRDYWSRICDLGYPIATSALEVAASGPKREVTAFLAAKGNYINLIHNFSLLIRSELLKRACPGPITIYGGDPSYMHGKSLGRNIQLPNFSYLPATENSEQTIKVYNHSLININITSLQFDTAVINRVIDIGASGGFPLTDWKEDLSTLTTVHREISYRSPEELEHKINYYTHHDNQKERLEICHTFYDEIQANYTYDNVVDYMLAKVSRSHQASPMVKVDLGCGQAKAHGFLGVDRAPAPSVDVVADLTHRFPFATSSVDQLRAHDIIEHLPDRIHTMNEIWRICKPGASVDIRVPSSDGRGAFQDPTHVSFWNLNSFYYYSRQFPAYFNLCQTYGFKGEFEILDIKQTSTPDQVIHLHVQLKVIKAAVETVGSNTPSPHPEAASEAVASPGTEAAAEARPGGDSWVGSEAAREEQSNNLETELREFNLLINLEQVGRCFDAQAYAHFKSLVLTLVHHPKAGRITLLVQSQTLDEEAIASLILELMFELIASEQLHDSQNLPNLQPAPKNLSLLAQVRPRIVKELILEHINSSTFQALLDDL